MSIFKCEISYNKIPNNSKISTKNKLVAHGFLDESYDIQNNDFYKASKELNLLASNKLGKDVNLYQVRDNVAIPNNEVFTEIDSINNLATLDTSSNNLNELEDKLKDGFLKDFGITATEYNNLKEDLGLDAYSASDIITKTIVYNKGESVIPEVAYFSYMMLGKGNNKIKSDLKYLIYRWEGFTKSFNFHSKELQERVGFIKDSKEWKTRVIEKVIIDFLKENLENYYLDPVNFKKQLDKKWTKSDFSLFAKIMEIIENFLFTKRGSIDRKAKEALEQIGLSIADEVLNQNYNYFNYSLNSSQIKKEYLDTLNSDSFAKEIVTTLKDELDLILTGSLTLRRFGSVYRSAKESIHDIDWIVPYSKIKDNPEVLDLIKKLTDETNKLFINKPVKDKDKYFSDKLVKNILPKMEWYKEFLLKYPNFTFLTGFVGKDNIESLSTITLTGVINGEFYKNDGYHIEEKTIIRKNLITKKVNTKIQKVKVKHSKGDYIKETGYIIDFFTRLLPKQEEHTSNFLSWKEITLAKLKMGREKDFIDWVAFTPNIASSNEFNFNYKDFRNLSYSKNNSSVISTDTSSNQEQEFPIEESNFDINIPCVTK